MEDATMQRKTNNFISLLLAAIMITGMFVSVPLTANADEVGYDYEDFGGKRLIKTFTLVGTFEGGKINNISNRTVADNCEAYLWDSDDEKFYPVEMSGSAIIGNFVEMRSTAPSGNNADCLLIVSWEDSEDYWDSGMHWDDKWGDDDGAFSAGQEWRIPYGERYIKGYRADGATVDFSNIVDYGALQDSTYWPLHDYYNATSSATLTMLTGFRTTQQNTGWACGTTSALMVLDWFGLRGDLNEQDIAALRLKTADGGATNLQQLINVFECLNELNELGKGEWSEWEIYSSYDVAAENGITKPAGGKMNLMSVDDLMDGTMFKEFLERGIPVMIGWNSFGGHWQVIIGYDDMGTVDTKDDVLILADPYDTTDHLNDGYNIQSLERFVYDWSAGFDPDFRHGIFVAAAPAGWDYTPDYGAGIIEYKVGYDGDASDDMKLSYGRSAADIQKYYPGTPWRGDNGLAGAATGGYERVGEEFINTSPYYAHYDYYDWSGDESPVSGGNLIMLEGFKTQQQTTEWTCGLTSALMALEWYDANPGLAKLLNAYSDEELAEVAEEYGFDAIELLDDRLTEINLAMLRGTGRTSPGATTLNDMKKVFDSLNEDTEYLNAMAAANGWSTLKKWEYQSTSNLVSSAIDGHALADGVADDGLIPYYLELGCPILIGWDEWGGHWQVIVGYDDMGTDDTQDDVLILADPYDTTDQNQDGYYLEAFERLVYGWGAAFNSNPSSNVFLIPYLIETDIPVDSSAVTPDATLDAILEALDTEIGISELTDADAAIGEIKGYLSGLGYVAGNDYAIADASVLVNGTSDFKVIPGGETLTVRIRCGVEYDVIALTFVQKTYTLTVESGTGGGDFAEGTEVTLTADAAPSGRVFDKWTSDNGGTFVNANSASTTFTMPANDVTVTATYKNRPSGSGSGSTPTQPTTKIDGVDVNNSVDSNGVVTLKPTSQQLDKLLKTIGDDGVLNVSVSDIPGMNSSVIELDLAKLTANDKLQEFAFSVRGHELRLPMGALESMQKLAKTLRFRLTIGSIIFELTDANGKAIDWYDYANPVTVSMPFAAPQDISTHQIVMIDKADDTIIPRSWFADGNAYAKVSAPGTYDAAIKPLAAFTDTDGLWMAEAVGYMGVRGIVEGIGDGLFDAQGTITRAHFVTMLMRALDLPGKAGMLPADFGDVPVWARPYVADAAALGLLPLDKDGNFNPNAPILRQDMFYMAYEAMELCGMLPSIYTQNIIPFTDWNDVEAEHADALQNLAKLGLVKGNGDGTLNPNGESTRSEGAQFLYNILKYDAK